MSPEAERDRAFFDAVHEEIQRQERARKAEYAAQWRPTEASAEKLAREAASADAGARWHMGEALRLAAYAERMRVSAELARAVRK